MRHQIERVGSERAALGATARCKEGLMALAAATRCRRCATTKPAGTVREWRADFEQDRFRALCPACAATIDHRTQGAE